MNAQIGVKNQAVVAETSYTTHSVTSKDGTIIGYRQLGHGPGVVLVHGAMETGQSHIQLAEALADRFTLYLPDRRGRGMSGAYQKNHHVQREVEDLDALLSQTGAHNIFGLSAGGVIGLQAALTLPAVHKAAIYDPALSINGSVPMDFLTRYDEEMAQGKIADALVTGMLASQMGPPIFNSMPRWLLKFITSMTMDSKFGGNDATFRMLAPTLHYEFGVVAEVSEQVDSFKAIPAEVLLLGGSESPAYLKLALDTLEKIIPHVRRVEFPGLGHGGSGNKNQNGKPEIVAQALRQFFI